MKQLKQVDFFISTGLIIAYVIIILIEPKKSFINNGYLIQGYFVVGAWQIISMIVHVVFKNRQALSSIRKTYNWITVVCIVTMPMGFVMLAILLYAAPLLATFYTGICGFEVFKKVERPLDNLK